MIQFDEHMFQTGWFNYQLLVEDVVKGFCCFSQRIVGGVVTELQDFSARDVEITSYFSLEKDIQFGEGDYTLRIRICKEVPNMGYPKVQCLEEVIAFQSTLSEIKQILGLLDFSGHKMEILSICLLYLHVLRYLIPFLVFVSCKTRWRFQIFLFSPLLGEDSHFD